MLFFLLGGLLRLDVHSMFFFAIWLFEYAIGCCVVLASTMSNMFHYYTMFQYALKWGPTFCEHPSLRFASVHWD